MNGGFLICWVHTVIAFNKNRHSIQQWICRYLEWGTLVHGIHESYNGNWLEICSVIQKYVRNGQKSISMYELSFPQLKSQPKSEDVLHVINPLGKLLKWLQYLTVSVVYHYSVFRKWNSANVRSLLYTFVEFYVLYEKWMMPWEYVDVYDNLTKRH